MREAESGAEALELVSGRPDLVILDVKLPDISGFEVCRRIKSDPATAVIPVLHISTTFVHLEDKIQGLDSGADGYLTNVAEPMEVIATVRALLRARRAEESAQLTTRQWQTTFDAISDGVMLLDASGRVVQANRTLELILGRTWSEIVGRELTELWDQRWRGEISPFARMVVSGCREAEDLSLGDSWLHVSVDPLRHAGGEISGALCIVSDITHRKRMEMQLFRQAEELQKAGQRKDEFLAMLAHELRNPLAPLANTLQIIRMQVKGNDLVEESLDIAGRQIKHMARLLEDLFDVSRTTRGMVELRKRTVDLKTVVNHAVEAASPLIRITEARALQVASPRCAVCRRRPDAARADRLEPAEQRRQVHRARRQDRRHAFAKRRTRPCCESEIPGSVSHPRCSGTSSSCSFRPIDRSIARGAGLASD